MVRRLIERKEIIGTKHQFCHGKTCTFPSGKDSHFLVNILSLKKESSQNVAQLQTYIPHSYSVKSIIDSVVLVKDIFLILRIIANADIIADTGLPLHRLQFTHDCPHQCGLSLAIPSDKSNLLSAFDLDVRTGKHNLVSIAERKIRSLVGYVSRARRRRKLHGKCGLVLQIHLDALQFLKLLHSGLYLIGLCWLVAETLNEIFCLFNHPLLILVGRLLLGNAFLPEFQILAVGNLVVVYVTEHNLYCPVRDIVQKLPVVRYQHH